MNYIIRSYRPLIGISSTLRFPVINRRHHMHSTVTECYHNLVRSTVPTFQANALMPNGEFKQISSSDYKGMYWVLFFYPLDFTFVCPTELIAFHEHSKEFDSVNCKLVACSVDSEYSHLAWTKVPRESGGLGSSLSFPILSDLNKSISEKFNVLLASGVSLRGLFIMDPKGIIRHSTINDLPIGRSVDEVLRTVKAIQYVDQNGEVCPANWRPGSKAINPKHSEKYFKTLNQ